MMAKHFWNGDGEIVAKVYDQVNKQEMNLRRLESFEELKSNINFSHILIDYRINKSNSI